MRKYFLPFLQSLALHLSIIALFFLNASIETPDPSAKQKKAPEIIKATILDESVVIAKANELKQQQENKKQLQKQQRDDYARKLEQEKHHLQQLKDQRLQVEKEAKKLAEQRQAEVKNEQKKLQDIKKKLVLEQKKQQETVRKRKAEAKRIAEKKRQAEAVKQEAARKEAAKQQKIAAEKRQKEQEEKLRVAAAREAEQSRQRAKNTRIAKKASADARALIKRKVTQNWNRPVSVSGKLRCKIRIGLIPSGDVMSVVVVESSGNQLFDESAERAVRKASPLPVPKDPNVFQGFRSFNLEFAPD
ncbi:colicin import membrane protein [Bathymodiolus platifrons methanotrophic gill symbiont]|uniref:cell envelope integrity protein TolA n=1 Tax=Bathymodiolus platifrons methanotrophic gill symbiont TaxID=113268 RepID=UPI001B685B9D|nr:cell envelope integrity protein TolA [Bathymodiolus platifrons methanotrophic gill symbiont]GFO73981.1 colicin import membrane protein [Bathymodiolus platifrons methanotrophic gill symbiont]